MLYLKKSIFYQNLQTNIKFKVLEAAPGAAPGAEAGRRPGPASASGHPALLFTRNLFEINKVNFLCAKKINVR